MRCTLPGSSWMTAEPEKPAPALGLAVSVSFVASGPAHTSSAITATITRTDVMASSASSRPPAAPGYIARSSQRAAYYSHSGSSSFSQVTIGGPDYAGEPARPTCSDLATANLLSAGYVAKPAYSSPGQSLSCD